MKNYNSTIRNELINKYKETHDSNAIMEEYNLKWFEYYDLIAPCLEHDINKISKEQIEEIILLYNMSISTTKIGEKLGIHHKLVSQILKDNGVGISQSKSIRKYTIDSNYFNKIDSPNKAYILGLLYADGYNNERKKQVSLSLVENDKSLLESICKELNYNKPLVFLKNNDHIAKNGYISNDMYLLVIYNAQISNDLKAIGVNQCKSLNLTFPHNLDQKYYSHFIRGYFDGDGSYCHRYAENYGWRDVVTFTSTEVFCKALKEIINENSNAKGGNIYDASCHNGITKVLSFSGARQVKSLLDYLYKDAELFLYRKYNLYISTFYS